MAVTKAGLSPKSGWGVVVGESAALLGLLGTSSDAEDAQQLQQPSHADGFPHCVPASNTSAG